MKQSFHNPKMTSISLSVTKSMVHTLKKMSQMRGCSERRVASELLHCAMADEIRKIEALFGNEWDEDIKIGGTD
jgi:hypothetical protein